jgi:hypothetical protein
MLLLWPQGEKTRKATDGRQGLGLRSVAFTLPIDFWKQRKKPGKMCTKMPFLILIVLDAFKFLRGYLMLLLPLISVVLMGGIFFFDRTVRFRAHNTPAEQKVVALRR